MSTPVRPAATEHARRAYRCLLRLTPRRLRQKHGREMEEIFVDALTEARTRGSVALLAAWIRATADILRGAAAGRLRPPITMIERPSTGATLMLSTYVRYAVRSLLRQRLSTSLVILMLALGVAANVVVFSLVNGLFLRPFPVPEPDRLVYINEKAPRWNLDEHVGINYPDFHQWRQAAKLFDALALFDDESLNLTTANGAERVRALVVTSDFARVLGVRPLIGRMFTAEEDRPNGPRVVLIGSGLWQERFAGDPAVLGTPLRLNSVPHTIVGVLPPEATWLGESRLWVPRRGDPSQDGSYSGAALGRLRAGVTVADAEKDLLRAHEPIWETRDQERIVSPYVKALREELSGEFRAMASTLTAAVGLLLLIACANVGSVMLGRALARRREMGIRLAVGAGRVRLLQQLFVENFLLAAIGGMIGLALGFSALRLLVAALGDEVPRWASFDLDWRIVLFAAATSGLTTVLFGWAPALHALRGNLWSAARDAGSGSTSAPGGRRTLSWLVGAELALATVLIVCGGLLLRAYDRARNVDPGFRADHVLTFGLSLPDASYADDAERLLFWDGLIDRLKALPGVNAAGLVSCAPFGCHSGTFYAAEGHPPPRSGDRNPVVLYRPASHGYFQAMGIRLKSGRFFSERDGRDDTPQVVVVNETFAKTFFPNTPDPVGQRIRTAVEGSPWLTIVGIAHDVKHYGLEQPMRPGLYLPLPANASRDGMTVALRTAGEPSALVASARRQIAELDPGLALYQVSTMEHAVNRSLARRHAYSVLLVVFAALALVLALGGIYGVASYVATQRTREIGIRVALGARAGHIVRTLLGGSLVSLAVGISLGVLLAVGSARLLADLLFDVSPHDAAILLAGVGVMVMTALAANWLPLRRAARTDPKILLRIE